jgi:hypothetical protein
VFSHYPGPLEASVRRPWRRNERALGAAAELQSHGPSEVTEVPIRAPRLPLLSRWMSHVAMDEEVTRSWCHDGRPSTWRNQRIVRAALSPMCSNVPRQTGIRPRRTHPRGNVPLPARAKKRYQDAPAAPTMMCQRDSAIPWRRGLRHSFTPIAREDHGSNLGALLMHAPAIPAAHFHRTDTARLSEDHYQLIRDYLARAKADCDPYAIQLWMDVTKADTSMEPVDISRLAATCHTDELTVTALMTGLSFLKQRGHEIDLRPWPSFQVIGMEFDDRRADDSCDLPARGAIHASYNTAIRDIEARRGTHQFGNGFYRQVSEAVFDTCYQALEHVSAWIDQKGPPDKATIAELREAQRPRLVNAMPPRLHVVSAPMGAGKTTFSIAFAIAMVRLSKRLARMPYGCAFLVDQIVKADMMYRELFEHLPEKVAIWTSDHDVNCENPTRLIEPAARFHIDDLQHYPVVIVTHALFQSERSEKARLVVRDGTPAYRGLTLVDEQMQDVTIYDVKLSSAEKVREAIQQEGDQDVAQSMETLVKFMMGKVFDGRSLEKPSDDERSWRIAEALSWFGTEDAQRYASANRERWPDVDRVFGFARCMTRDYAFVARHNNGAAGTHFVGYEPKHAIVPGMVLLDATADIDGVTPICPWRTHADVPRGRYDNLSIVHVESCTNQNLKKYLSQAGNRRTYAEWMKEIVIDQMEPGQLGLVVCKKTLVDNENIPGPFPKDPSSSLSADTTPFGWDIDGRQLGVTYWGGSGLGSNAWKDAEIVFLFDEFFLPRRTAIGNTQGHMLAPSSSGVIASMNALNTTSDAVSGMWEGHLLRWMKQMALRGRGRLFDEHGVCGKQKLVVTGSYERLLLNKDKLFPGASLSAARSDDKLSRYSRQRQLLEILGRSTDEEVTTKQISDRMYIPWREISKDIMTEDTREMLRVLGWLYVPKKGPSGSVFRKVPPRQVKTALYEHTVALCIG